MTTATTSAPPVPNRHVKTHRGTKLLHDPILNKGTAFSHEEREAFGLRGLLPPRVMSQDAQVERMLENLRREQSDLDRYLQLVALQDRNEQLFYRIATDHIEEIMPLVYTPTVGRACQIFGHIFRRPRGLYISAEDRGSIASVLANWPHQDVRMVVVTDGARILGLGDLGANGMGIPIGKLSLYVACAGLHPIECLPITIDVGTNNEQLLEDPLYLGLQQRRLSGEAYDDLIEEFVTALQERFPHAVLQFEDFSTANAFTLLRRYRDRVCSFNDDIQGTAAVSLAGLLSALRLTGGELADQRIVFVGAGEAGTGIGELITSALVQGGMGAGAARQHCWYVDSKGLVVAGREHLAEHKRPFAHQHEPIASLEEVVKVLEPTVLLGVSGTTGAFTRPVVETMARLNERPIIFALSNPTSKAECTARQAYEWTGGRAIFASGSPFPPVDLDGSTHVPGQGNNAYIFPGIGLALITCGATRVTDEMFAVAAKTLAAQVSDADLAIGRVYPSLQRIRQVSAAIATAVAEVAYSRDLAAVPRPADLATTIRERMFDPTYEPYV